MRKKIIILVLIVLSCFNFDSGNLSNQVSMEDELPGMKIGGK